REMIGGVWALSRFLPLDALTRSLLWKMALVGGLFTATLQTGLGVEPLFGTVSVKSGAAEPAPVAAPPPPPPVRARPMAPSRAHVVIVRDSSVTAVFTGSRPVPALASMPPLPPPPPPPVVAAASPSPPVGTAAWVLAGLFVAGAAAS